MFGAAATEPPHDANLASGELPDFLAPGWEVLCVLGTGARGPVRLVHRNGSKSRRLCSARRSAQQRFALKQSTLGEVEALQELRSCKHVITLVEHMIDANVSEDASVWARLEWLRGGCLRSFMRDSRNSSRGGVPEDMAQFLAGEVLTGLCELHERSWMHRDVKAENIGLCIPYTDPRIQPRSCTVKLLDFDCAVFVHPGEKLTEVIGTVENMAPEVFQGSYDKLADCWSLGVVAFELLYSYRPFNDTSLDGIEEMITNWQCYLVLPFDAAPAPSSFIRRLLVGCESRMSSSIALDHDWMRERIIFEDACHDADSSHFATSCNHVGIADDESLCSAGLSVERSSTGRFVCSDGDSVVEVCDDTGIERLEMRTTTPTTFAPEGSGSTRALPVEIEGGSAGDAENTATTVEHLGNLRKSLSEWTAQWEANDPFGGLASAPPFSSALLIGEVDVPALPLKMVEDATPREDCLHSVSRLAAVGAKALTSDASADSEISSGKGVCTSVCSFPAQLPRHGDGASMRRNASSEGRCERWGNHDRDLSLPRTTSTKRTSSNCRVRPDLKEVSEYWLLQSAQRGLPNNLNLQRTTTSPKGSFASMTNDGMSPAHVLMASRSQPVIRRPALRPPTTDARSRPEPGESSQRSRASVSISSTRIGARNGGIAGPTRPMGTGSGSEITGRCLPSTRLCMAHSIGAVSTPAHSTHLPRAKQLCTRGSSQSTGCKQTSASAALPHSDCSHARTEGKSVLRMRLQRS